MGGDMILLIYRDVVCENIQKQGEHMSALLEKTRILRLSQESFPSGLGYDSPPSDEELDVPSSQNDESNHKTARNAQICAQERSIQDANNPSVCSDAIKPQTQETVVEGGLEGISPTNNPKNQRKGSKKRIQTVGKVL